jgi:glycosyltransferase involved in cell wall biosynthesis
MTAFSQSLRRVALRQGAILRDRIRYSAAAQIASGMWLLLKSVFPGDPSRRLAALASAHRTFLAPGWERLTRTRMIRVAPSPAVVPNPWRAGRIGWTAYPVRTVEGKTALSHGLIVKPPVSEREKGVLVVWVEYNLAALLSSACLAEILRSYRIVFSTSWSPPDFSLIWALSGEPGAEFCIIPSNPKDEKWINAIARPLTILPFFASHWIADDPNARLVPHAERTYDLCVVANWAPFKRHWLLFRALRSLPADLKIALIGQPESDFTLEHVQQLAEAFRVVQPIEWFNRLPAEEVRRIQADSRVGLMLSKREGSCLAVAESLLADAPAGVLRDAHIGSREFINEETGMLLREDRLAQDLATLLEGAAAGRFRPREWALREIEAGVSSSRLDTILRDLALSKGEEWTQGIKGFCLRSAVPSFLEARDAVEAESWHRAFEADYDLVFAGPSRQAGSAGAKVAAERIMRESAVMSQEMNNQSPAVGGAGKPSATA